MRAKLPALGVVSAALLGSALGGGALDVPPARAQTKATCSPEMARFPGFCIDRWEVHTVDAHTGLRLSPFYPPDPKLLRFAHDYWSVESSRTGSVLARAFPLPLLPQHQRGNFSPRAVSAPGVLPQGYLSHHTAKLACENAGKRLCTEAEWVKACRGARGTKHPYGDEFVPGRCNVFRNLHPAYELHGNSSVGHLDPRLHLVFEEGKRPLLELTGARSACASRVRPVVKAGDEKDLVFDLVGNLDEWIADENGTFVGGFYSRSTREGCEAKIDSHAPGYVDYSLGTRCCK